MVVVGAEGFFWRGGGCGGDPLWTLGEEWGMGDARDGFMRKGMWRSGLFLWLESSEWVCGERWLWRFAFPSPRLNCASAHEQEGFGRTTCMHKSYVCICSKVFLPLKSSGARSRARRWDGRYLSLGTHARGTQLDSMSRDKSRQYGLSTLLYPGHLTQLLRYPEPARSVDMLLLLQIR
jgi:hypothetical protein